MNKRKGVFALLIMVALMTGCGNPSAVTTEHTSENAAGEATENNTENREENDTAAGEIEIPDVLPEAVAAYQEKRTYYYAGGDISAVRVYTYDERDNWLSEESIDPVSGESLAKSERRYMYDRNGQIQVRFYVTLDEYETYQYHEDGTVKECLSYRQGKLSRKQEYEYDEHGKETLEVETIYLEGQEPKVSQKKTGHCYDDRGNETETIDYDEEGEENFRCCFEYDANDRIVKSYYLWNGQSDYSVYETYQYDDNGNMIRWELCAKEEDSSGASIYEIYEYDANNRKMKEEKYEDGKLDSYIIMEYMEY